VRPKSVARELVESFSGFDEYVRKGGHARVEGLLLRYLSQTHNTLAHGVPAVAKTDEVLDIQGYLRALLARVDSSLVSEWESLVRPSEAPDASAPIDAAALERMRARRDPAADPRAFRARIRAELHLLVQALAAGDFVEAAACLRHDDADPWTAERIERELAPYLEEYGRVTAEPRARQAHLTNLREREARIWDVQQALVDDAGDNAWAVHAQIDLRDEVSDGPLIELIRIGL
jgi:hypothetical protein